MLLISGKIPVRVHPFFWLLIIAIGWLNSFSIMGTVIWGMVILFSVLVHEYGHALTAVAFGQRAHIQLMGLGGATYRSGQKLKLWQEFLIVLNGPLAGFALFLIALALRNMIAGRHFNLFVYAVNITVIANLFWTIVNLLPIQPLDGGHLLRIILESMFGFRGVKIAFFISLLLAASISIFFISIQALLLGIIFLLLTFESFRLWKSTMELSEGDRDTALQEQFQVAEQEFQHGDKEETLQKFQRIRDISKSGVIYVASTEYMADILNFQKKYKEAYAILSPLKRKLSTQGLHLLHRLAFKIEHYDEAITLGNRIYQLDPTYETALMNALSNAVLVEPRSAVGWLQSAIKDGLPNVKDVLERKEFDGIRNSPEFMKVTHQLS